MSTLLSSILNLSPVFPLNIAKEKLPLGPRSWSVQVSDVTFEPRGRSVIDIELLIIIKMIYIMENI